MTISPDPAPPPAARPWQDALLASVVENLPCGLSVFDAQLRLVAHNHLWQQLLDLPENLLQRPDAGFEDFAAGWNPILDVFDQVGVRFAFEVHPSEIAYDYWTAERALEAIGHREAFGLNWDPSHMVWQEVDPVGFLLDFADRIYHVHCKDSKVQTGNGRNARLSSHLDWADARRGWDFVSVGLGDVPWQRCFRALNQIGYQGPLSVEWEDIRMDRIHGATEASAFVRRLDFPTNAVAFDAAFEKKNRAQ